MLEFEQGIKGRPSVYRLIPPSMVLEREAAGDGQPNIPEGGVPYYLDGGVDDITLYFGWSEAVGKELAQITKELFDAYWPDHVPDDRDRQRVFELTKEQREVEGEKIIVFPEDRKGLLAYAFEAASRAGVMNWNYIYGVMRTLGERGIYTLQQAWEYDEERSRKNGW